MSNKPLILSDNLFESVLLHPTFNVFNNNADDAVGHEVFRIADNLRDMTYWTPTTSNVARSPVVDCLAAVSPNVMILDRGHNAAGKQISLTSFTDTTFGTLLSTTTCTIPATPGGLPTDANGCLTPDGVWWKTFTPVASRVWAFTYVAGQGAAPIFTGVYLGTSYRFPEYLNAPAAYDFGTSVKFMRNEMSRGGVRSKSRPIDLDIIPLSIDLDSADYSGFDAEVRRLVRYGQPWWFAFDDSDTTGVGQMRLFQLAQDFKFDPQVNPVHRQIRLELEEVIPTLYA